MALIQNHTQKFIANIKQGYSNEFVKNDSKNLKMLKGKNHENKKTIKNFLIVKLINDNVIDSITFENKNQPKLEQKSSLTFERHENGYTINLIYKEVNRQFICCLIENHEYILDSFELANEVIIELRRIARTNSTFTLANVDRKSKEDKEDKESKSQIRFNIFYLVNLLNSLEAD